MTRHSLVIPLLVGPLLGWVAYKVTHRGPLEVLSPSPMPAPALSVELEQRIERLKKERAEEDQRHAALMKKKQDGLNDRWDKCVAAHGLPVPGFEGVEDPERWGLMCIRPQSVIYIDNTAW